APECVLAAPSRFGRAAQAHLTLELFDFLDFATDLLLELDVDFFVRGALVVAGQFVAQEVFILDRRQPGVAHLLELEVIKFVLGARAAAAVARGRPRSFSLAQKSICIGSTRFARRRGRRWLSSGPTGFALGSAAATTTTTTRIRSRRSRVGGLRIAK